MVKSPLVIGIGGNIGAGKTTLAKIFQSFGAKIIDADKIGWSLLKQSSKEYHKIVKNFGRSILTRNGNISRHRLGAIVFDNPQKLKLLNQIVHPRLLAQIRNGIQKKKGVVVLDAALLFNWGLEKEVDAAILVSASKNLKIERSQKSGMSKQTAEKRLAQQLPEKVMVEKADFIVKNNGTKQTLRKKAKALWKVLNGLS